MRVTRFSNISEDIAEQAEKPLLLRIAGVSYSQLATEGGLFHLSLVNRV